MADNSLTIGATFDKGQLDAAIAEGAAAVKQLPNSFNLAFREMSTSSQRALRQISADTKAAAANVTAGWRSVADASATVAASQREVRAAMKLTSDSALNQADTLAILAAAKQKAALAAQSLAAAEEDAAASTAEDAVATTAAAGADERLQYSMAYGAARIGAYAGGVGSLGYALGSVTARMGSLAPIMATLFEVTAPIAFGYIIVQIAESFKKWYDNAVLLKQELSDLGALVAQTSGGMNTDQFALFQAQAERMRANGDPLGALQFLQEHADQQPIKIGLKIKQADLDKVTSILDESHLPGSARDIVNQLQAPDLTLGQAAEKLPAIADELARIDRIKGEKNLYGDLTHNTQQIAAINAVRDALQNITAQIYLLKQASDEKSGTSVLEVEKEATGRGARTLSELDTKNASAEKDALKNANEQWSAQLSKHIAGASAGAEREANSILKNVAAINAQADANARLWDRIHEGITQAAKGAEEYDQGIARLFQEQADNYARGVKLPKITDLGDALKQSVSHIGSAFDTMMNGVLMGTQRMSVAWRRMGADMAASFIESMAKIEITNAVNEMRMTVAHIAGTQARVAATAAGTAEESSIGLIATLKAVNREAVKAAGGAYSAVVGIPIIGPVLAPIAAGVAFAGVEAFGALASAEGGQWKVPNPEQLTLVHGGETILPAKYAEPLRRTVEGGGGGGRPVHFHFAPVINAVDRNGVDSMLREHGDRFASAMQRHIRKALA